MTTAKKATKQTVGTDEQEPTLRNIHQRMLAIMHDAEVGKHGTAPKQVGGFAFHRIDDVEAVLKPLLVKHGVNVTVSVDKMNPTIENGWNCATVEIAIRLINADTPNDLIEIKAFGQGLDKQDKAIGKAISYATKSAYLANFHLKGQLDVEADSTDEHVPADIPPPGIREVITNEQVKALWATAQRNGWTDPKLFVEACEEVSGYKPREIPSAGDTYAKTCDYFADNSPKDFDIDVIVSPTQQQSEQELF